jgi:hypothetical protein
MKLKMIGYTHGHTRSAYKFFVENPEGNRTPVRSWNRWEDNIKIYLEEIGWECVAVGGDLWRAVVNTIMNFRFHERWKL